MESLIINATSSTPSVEFDGNTGVFSITGKSYPENVNDFYFSVFDYINLYKKTPKPRTILHFNWLYYNTATSKIIVKIIQLLKNVSPEFEVKWYCKKDFEMMIEKGEELREVLEVNLNVVYV